MYKKIVVGLFVFISLFVLSPRAFASTSWSVSMGEAVSNHIAPIIQGVVFFTDMNCSSIENTSAPGLIQNLCPDSIPTANGQQIFFTIRNEAMEILAGPHWNNFLVLSFDAGIVSPPVGGSGGSIDNSSITNVGLSALQTFGLSALMLLGAIILLLGAFFLYKWMMRKIFGGNNHAFVGKDQGGNTVYYD